MMMSAVRESAMALNAPPMITPTAMSITLPRAMKVLNSLINFFIAGIVSDQNIVFRTEKTGKRSVPMTRPRKPLGPKGFRA